MTDLIVSFQTRLVLVVLLTNLTAMNSRLVVLILNVIKESCTANVFLITAHQVALFARMELLKVLFYL